MKRKRLICALAGTSMLIVGAASGTVCAQGSLSKVLVVDAWQAAQHISTRDGDSMMTQLARTMGFKTVISPDGSRLTDAELTQYQVVVFNNVDYNPLTADQKAAFQKYVDRGGGYVGWHASAAIHGLWPWYIQYIGADIRNHPATVNARIYTEMKNKSHPAMAGVPDTFFIQDEWYNYDPDPSKTAGIAILQLIDEKSYSGGTMGYHPITWAREYGANKSRMFFCSIGHQPANYRNASFRTMIGNALKWAAKAGATGIKPAGHGVRNLSAIDGATSFDAENPFRTIAVNGRSIYNSKSCRLILCVFDKGRWTPAAGVR